MAQNDSFIRLPQIPLLLNETYRLDLEQYFREPNMEYGVFDNKSEECSSYINITTPDPIVEKYTYTIKQGVNQISFECSSKLVKFQDSSNKQRFYMAFYTSDFDFYIYDISNFNELCKEKDQSVKLVLRQSFLQLEPDKIRQFESCEGLRIRDDNIFYTLCSDYEGNIDVVNIQVKGLNNMQSDNSNIKRVILWATRLHNTNYVPGTLYTVFADRYIYYPKYTEDSENLEVFCFDDFINPTKSDNSSPLLKCTFGLVNEMKRQISNDIDEIYELKVSDLSIIDNYLFISEVEYGIFVIILGPGILVPEDVFLYSTT